MKQVLIALALVGFACSQELPKDTQVPPQAVEALEGNFNTLIQLGTKLLTKLTDKLPEGGLEALDELDLSSVKRRRRDTVAHYVKRQAADIVIPEDLDLSAATEQLNVNGDKLLNLATGLLTKLTDGLVHAVENPKPLVKRQAEITLPEGLDLSVPTEQLNGNGEKLLNLATGLLTKLTDGLVDAIENPKPIETPEIPPVQIPEIPPVQIPGSLPVQIIEIPKPIVKRQAEITIPEGLDLSVATEQLNGNGEKLFNLANRLLTKLTDGLVDAIENPKPIETPEIPPVQILAV
jgi:hypothetical protein